jgi:hypothetical protein
MKSSTGSEKLSTGSEKLSTGSEKFGTGSGRNGKFIAGGGKGGSDFRPLIRGRLSFDSYNDSVNSDMNDDDSDESLDKVSNKLDNMVIVERNNGGDIVKGMSRSVDMTGNCCPNHQPKPNPNPLTVTNL